MNYITQKERLEKALKLINRLKENNYEKVSKILGIGLFLYKLLSDFLNDPIKEDLKIFDKYSKEKKIFTSVFALIFLLKLKIITNIPVMIVRNNALVDLGSFEINGVG